MTDEEILAQFSDCGSVIEGEALQEENKRKYEEYLQECYFRDKKNGNAYCDTYENWYNSYWKSHCLSYSDWLKK